MKEVNKAYWAGLLDGEGSIVISKSGDNYHFIRIMIYQKDPMVLKQAQEEFGVGSLQTHLMGLGGPVWSWHTTTNKAEKVLREIIPYLRIKRKQAELALEYQEYKRATDIRGKRKNGVYMKMSQEVIDKREWFKQEISRFNHK